MILIAATVAIADDSIPEAVRNYYGKQRTVYWEVTQIVNSSLFDEAETTTAKFYVEKPDRMLIIAPDREVFVRRDTVWVYVPRYKQIQRSSGQYVVNPLDFIEHSSSEFELYRLGDNRVLLKSADGSIKPDSIVATYDVSGKLRLIEYVDPNEQKVQLLFKKESFKKKFPSPAFFQKISQGVQIIDLDNN